MIEKKNLKLLVFVIISLLLIAVSSSSLMGFFYGYRSLRINIPTSEGKLLTGKLYIPSSIKNENTPAVLICHGANNEYSANVMAQVIGPQTKEICLAHLSQEANTPEMALATYHRVFKERNVDFSQIKVASQVDVVSGGQHEN